MERPEDNPLLVAPLRVDTESFDNLNAASKWTKFISLSIFVMTALFAVMMIAGASFFLRVIAVNNSASPLGHINIAMIVVIIIVFAVLITFIYLFLYQFSRRMKNALLSGDTAGFQNALSSLKTYFIISVVLGVIGILYNVYLMLLKNGSFN